MMLGDTKGNDKKSNLLQFLVSAMGEYEEKGGCDVATLPTQLASVTAAAKLQVPFAAQQDYNTSPADLYRHVAVLMVDSPNFVIWHEAMLFHG